MQDSGFVAKRYLDPELWQVLDHSSLTWAVARRLEKGMCSQSLSCWFKVSDLRHKVRDRTAPPAHSGLAFNSSPVYACFCVSSRKDVPKNGPRCHTFRNYSLNALLKPEASFQDPTKPQKSWAGFGSSLMLLIVCWLSTTEVSP